MLYCSIFLHSPNNQTKVKQTTVIISYTLSLPSSFLSFFISLSLYPLSYLFFYFSLSLPSFLSLFLSMFYSYLDPLFPFLLFFILFPFQFFFFSHFSLPFHRPLNSFPPFLSHSLFTNLCPNLIWCQFANVSFFGHIRQLYLDKLKVESNGIISLLAY